MKHKIIWNILLHYDKYKKYLGLPVKIVKNNGLEKYDKLFNKTGIVTDFEFYNIKKPIIVTFYSGNISSFKKKKFCFSFDEIRKVGDEE